MCKKEQKHISFLLGAGFSVPAGLPTAGVLNSIIKASIYDYIRKSFRDGGDGMLQSYILEKVLIDYDEVFSDFNYEQYYDSLEQEKTKKLDKDRLFSFIERGMYGYFWKCSTKKNIDAEKRIAKISDAIVAKCDNYSSFVEGQIERYQHLIAKNLIASSKNGYFSKINPCYKGFLDVLNHYYCQGYIINVFTLNHDLLLESLLALTELKDLVCDGFGDEVSQIGEHKYKFFDINNFNKPIRVYKLHCSIDIQELSFAEKKDKQYIKIISGYSEKNAFIMDSTKFASVRPSFLTGKFSKEKKYDQEPFNLMLNEFKNNIIKTAKLIVIGYSGNDDGINRIVYDNYSRWKSSFIVCPNACEHPFIKTQKAKPLNKGVESFALKDINS